MGDMTVEEGKKIRSSDILTVIRRDNVMYDSDKNAYWLLFGKPRGMKVAVVMGGRGEKVFVEVVSRHKIHLYDYYDMVQKNNSIKIGDELDIEVFYRKPSYGRHTIEEIQELDKKMPYALYHYGMMQKGIVYDYVVHSLVVKGKKHTFYDDYEVVKLYDLWQEEVLEVVVCANDRQEIYIESPYYGRIDVRDEHVRTIQTFGKHVGDVWKVKVAVMNSLTSGDADFNKAHVMLIGSVELPHKAEVC